MTNKNRLKIVLIFIQCGSDVLRTPLILLLFLFQAQSIIWMGLTITAICAYNCVLYITNDLTYGSMVKTVFFDVYFKGSCKMNPSDYQNYDQTILNTVTTVFDPTQILIWNSVYLGVSVCWLIVSVVLLLCKYFKNRK